MPKDYADRIAKIQEQRKKLDARLNTLSQKASAEARKRDTRRKIIVGGAVISQIEKHPDFAALVGKLLDASVGRQSDRDAIADLLPSPSQAPAPSPSPSSPPATAPVARASASPPPASVPSAPTARESLQSLEGEMSRLFRRPSE